MSKDKQARMRRQSLNDSLKPPGQGGITMAGAKAMASGLNGTCCECTIIGYYRTSIFEYPAAYHGEDVCDVLHAEGGLQVAIVSDLSRYFSQCRNSHYAVDVSLRHGVGEAHDRALKAKEVDEHWQPLFLVVEEASDVQATFLNSGECYAVDEWIDGQPVVEGGRAGHKALVVFKTTDGSWPSFPVDRHKINVVLTAVKTERSFTGHIEELYSCDCLVTCDGRCVYYLVPTTSATARVIGRVDDARQMAAELTSILRRMMLESDSSTLELFDAMIPKKTQDDEYLRLWYLRLWQALEDAKKQLGYPQLYNLQTVLAGNRTPAELRRYRVDVAHWFTGRMDPSVLVDLQRTAIALLRKRYGADDSVLMADDRKNEAQDGDRKDLDGHVPLTTAHPPARAIPGSRT